MAGVVPPDDTEVVKRTHKAAEQGIASAQLFLASMYYVGRGVSQDYIQAHMWANLSASTTTGKEHDMAVGCREQVAKKMTPAQITEAPRLATEWMAKRK